MPFTMLLAVVLVAAAAAGTAAQDCATWSECRDRALDAAARQSYEEFHDFCWRAMQKGPRNDTGLMALLARAQSLSGRPHDALVMLERLSDLGVVTDAAESDDFRRVRALPGWADLTARIAGMPAGASGGPAEGPRAGTPAGRPAAGASSDDARSAPPTATEKTAGAAGVLEETSVAAGSEVLRIPLLPFTPSGLAHDAVSNRFIIGSRLDRKLTVVGEQSRRIANLAGPESAGFGEIAALSIDAREGDLWVVSTSGEPPSSRLHKLQLISGRLLYTVEPASGFEPAGFADVAVTPGSTVVVLDRIGRRVFRLAPDSRELQLAASLDLAEPASIAPASDAVAYVTNDRSVARVDFTSGSSRAVRAAPGIDLSGVAWIRWSRGALIAIQATDAGRYRIVRLTLDRGGRSVTALRVLAQDLAMSNPAAAVLSAGVLYYLTGAEGDADAAISRVAIR
ncbi:MAG TPA: hypothetical protein VLD67_16350 [Vicinamibacterales bacterium]|nr:hypothetical protein [Vicinamibacterales bacterium]